MGPATGIYEWHGGIARGYDIIRGSICAYCYWNLKLQKYLIEVCVTHKLDFL